MPDRAKESEGRQKPFLRDLYERSIGDIISSVVAILITCFVYFIILPDMNKEQYESTLLMGAITAANGLDKLEEDRNKKYEVYLHLEEEGSESSSRIQNRIYLLATVYKYKYLGSTPDFGENAPAVVYYDRDDAPAAERLAYLVNLILPPGKGEPITARLEPPENPEEPLAGKKEQLSVWLPQSYY